MTRRNILKEFYRDFESVYVRGMTHNIKESTQTNRTVYHSTMLALSSAAAIFIGQYVSSNRNDLPHDTYLVIISLIGFSLSIITLLISHFVHMLHDISWGQVTTVAKKAFEVKEYDVMDPKIFSDHPYFKDNKDELKRFLNGMKYSSFFLKFEIWLDVLMLAFILVSVISYCLFITSLI